MLSEGKDNPQKQEACYRSGRFELENKYKGIINTKQNNYINTHFISGFFYLSSKKYTGIFWDHRVSIAHPKLENKKYKTITITIDYNWKKIVIIKEKIIVHTIGEKKEKNPKHSIIQMKASNFSKRPDFFIK